MVMFVTDVVTNILILSGSHQIPVVQAAAYNVNMNFMPGIFGGVPDLGGIPKRLVKKREKT